MIREIKRFIVTCDVEGCLVQYETFAAAEDSVELEDGWQCVEHNGCLVHKCPLHKLIHDYDKSPANWLCVCGHAMRDHARVCKKCPGCLRFRAA